MLAPKKHRYKTAQSPHRTQQWDVPGIVDPATAKAAKRGLLGGAQPDKARANWADKAGVLGAMLLDLDGGFGKGNARAAQSDLRDMLAQRDAEAMAGFEKQRQAALMEAAAGGDERALFMLSPSTALNQKNSQQKFEYAKGRDQVADQRYNQSYQDQRSDRSEDVAFRDQSYQRGVHESDRTFEAQERARAQANAPKNMWVSLGDGVGMNQATGDMRYAYGGRQPQGMGDQSGQGDFIDIDQPQSPFDQMNIFGDDGKLIQARYEGPTQYTTPMESGNATTRQPGPAKRTDEGRIVPSVGEGGAGGTILDRKYDQEMGKRLAQWTSQDQAKALTQLDQLNDLIGSLEKPGNQSGGMKSLLPNSAQYVVNRDGIKMRAQAESIIQQAAKSILGGQFTEQEMKEFLKRQYDPMIGDEENSRRLKYLYNQLVNESRNLDYMARYAGMHGTMQGYTGQLPGMHDHRREDVPSILDDNDFDSLPSGAEFIDPNGQRRRKP